MYKATAVLVVVLALAAGCSQGSGGGGTTDRAAASPAAGQRATPRATASDDATPRATPSDDATSPSEDAAVAGGDGTGDPVETVPAGDAGEVDVRVVDGGVELVEVRAAAGWTHTVNKQERDKIELDFREQGGRLLRVEMELEDGRLKVESP